MIKIHVAMEQVNLSELPKSEQKLSSPSDQCVCEYVCMYVHCMYIQCMCVWIYDVCMYVCMYVCDGL